MNITIQRKIFTRQSTVGVMLINGRAECFTLEDFDRGLTNDMSDQQIEKGKVYGKTAIPYGTYEVAVTWSNHFGKYLPLLMAVKGFDGIRIHSGNTDKDTYGCVLVGDDKVEDKILNSRQAFARVFEKIRTAARYEKVYCTIEKAEDPQVKV